MKCETFPVITASTLLTCGKKVSFRVLVGSPSALRASPQRADSATTADSMKATSRVQRAIERSSVSAPWKQC